jgi:hypothetical protein
LVGALTLLQLLELLFFGIVITHGDNGDDKHGEKDGGAFNPAIFEPIIYYADDQRDKGGKQQQLEHVIFKAAFDQLPH